MNKLTIKWQRLVDAKGKTCPRCAATGKALAEAERCMKKALAVKGISVKVESKVMSAAEFGKDTQRSNLIEINGRPLEQWIGGKKGRSKCCSSCGDAQCRTIHVDGHVHEAIPVPLIVRAALVAASYSNGPADFRGTCRRCTPGKKRKTRCGKKPCRCPCS